MIVVPKNDLKNILYGECSTKIMRGILREKSLNNDIDEFSFV